MTKGVTDSGRFRQRLIDFEPYLLRARGRRAEPIPTAAQTVELLQQSETNRILTNWVVQVASLPEFRAMPGISLEEIRSVMPDLLQQTLLATACGDLVRAPHCIEVALPLALVHGKERHNSGFSINTLLTEYHLLHREVWTALWRLVDTGSAHRQSVRLLQPRLDAAPGRPCRTST